MTNLAHATLEVDARPVLARTEDAVWGHVDKERDGLYREFNDACQAAGIESELIKSPSLVYPAWVKFEVWLPTRITGITERASVIVTLEPMPHHRFEIQYKLTIEDRGRKKEIGPLHRAPKPIELVLFLLRRGRKPSYEPLRIRKSPFDIWRPKNKLVAIRPDWGGKLSFGLGNAVGVLGVVMLLRFMDGEAEASVAAFTFIAVAAGILWSTYRRPVTVLAPGKPPSEPRSLRLADSWQAVLFDIGNEHEAIRKRVRTVLAHRPDPRYKFNEETIWYWGLDGKVERQQFVLGYGRALVFCQVYRYGTGLYVGWDAHLNAGQWVESQVGRGIERRSGRLTQANTVMSGTQLLTEYDVTDLCCLTE